MNCVDVINRNPPSEMVEHPERMCNDDVNDSIPEHDGTDPKSIHFACPEQMPSSSDEQPKRGRGIPRKPKSPDTGDKLKRGRGRPHKPTPVKILNVTEEGHLSVKILPPVVMHLNQRSPMCITHVILQSQITTFTNRNSLLFQQLRGSALSALGGNSQFFSINDTSFRSRSTMHGIITSNAAALILMT